MAEITAALVKALREETGQGMMECKKALQETHGDAEAAKDLLRSKGLATAAKKAERAISEGRVVIRISEDGQSASMTEIRCETDFCAKNEVFVDMSESVADMVMAVEGEGPVEATEEMTLAVQETFNKIGENMSFSKGIKIAAPKIGTYLHHNGKVGVVVGIEGEVSDALLGDLCMHIAFADPVGISTDDVPTELIEKEKAFAKQQAIDSGKPEEIAEKMVAGKIRKFLEGKALLEQPFVRDEKQKVKDVLGNAKVLTFARFAIGQ